MNDLINSIRPFATAPETAEVVKLATTGKPSVRRANRLFALSCSGSLVGAWDDATLADRRNFVAPVARAAGQQMLVEISTGEERARRERLRDEEIATARVAAAHL